MMITKLLAGGLIALAILLAFPIPGPDDLFLNLPLSYALSKSLNISIIGSLVLTYTLIPFLLFSLAGLLLGKNVFTLIQSKLFWLKDPRILIVMVIITIIIYTKYYNYITGVLL